mmetsp:Transcript_13157/g.28389  ORF Transcript_13157/g.28389 Transcript_13157/m.28389 type:complete len:152 (-) Transcript_13157:445-900(-)
MSNSNEKIQEEILLSKRMFIGGCFGLPWLWICNALYFRLRVFGPLLLVDYWPGQRPPIVLDGEENDVDGGANDNNNNNDDDSSNPRRTMEQQLEYEMTRKQLSMWVKRSTIGAFVVMSLFVSWIITFQVNKDSFGPKWFVMDETDATKTGW